MEKYTLSFFYSKTNVKPEVVDLDVDSIKKKLTEYVKTTKINNKDELPLLFGGLYDNGAKSDNLKYRSLFIYDLDSYADNFNIMVNDIESSLSDYRYIYYTTYSHSFFNPKVRIILFPNSLIEPEVYCHLSRKIILDIFSSKLISAIDESCYEPTRRMYVPFRDVSKDKTHDRFAAKHKEGKIIDLCKYDYIYKTENNTQDFVNTESIIISDIELASNHLPLPDVTTDRVKEVLSRYDSANISYDEWRDVVFALHHQYQGSKEGLDILLEWSLKDDTKRTKESIISGCKTHYKNAKTEDKKRPLTFATIIGRVNDLQSTDTIEHKLIFPKKTKKGRVTNDHENYAALFEFYGVTCFFDIILKRIEIKINHHEYTNRVFFDEYDNNPDELSTKISWIKHRCTRHKLSIENKYLQDYINYIAHDNCINPVKDYLLKIKWDGIDRKEKFYSMLTVTNDNEDMKILALNKFIKQFLCLTCFNDKIIDLPARQVLILQGNEHIGKTTFLRNLLPIKLKAYFKTTKKVDLDKQMHLKNIVEAAIVEFGELKGTLMKSGFDAFKGFISDTEDYIDIKFERNHQKYRRRTSYTASLNDLEFLAVDDEHTRFLIIPVIRISREEFDICQLYAQIIEELKFEVSKCELEGRPLTDIYEMNRDELNKQIKFNLRFKFSSDADYYVNLVHTYINVKYPEFNIKKPLSSNAILTEIKKLDSDIIINDTTRKRLSKALKRCGYQHNSRYEYKVKFYHTDTHIMPEFINKDVNEDESMNEKYDQEEHECIDNVININEVPVSEIKYELIDKKTRLLHFKNYSVSGLTYGIDIETTGLNASNSQIALLQIYNPVIDKVFIYKVFDEPLTEEEKKLLAEIRFVAHNASFERSFMPYLKYLDCSMIVYHAVTSDKRTGLSDLSSKTGIVYSNKKLMQASNWAGELTEEQLEYAAKDAKATYVLWDIYKDKNKPVYDRMYKASFIIDEYARRGLPVDVEALKQLRIDTEKRKDEALQKIIDLGFEEIITPARNIRTKKELMAKVTPDVMEIVEEVRSANSLLNNMISGVENNIVDGRLPINVLICGTETGRLSTVNPNVQNFPRSGFRHIFKARDGYRFVRADFSGQELRMVAAMSTEKVMIEAFNAGKDLHTLMAAKLNNMTLKTFLEKPKEWQKAERQKAKAANFGFLYGMGASRFISTAKSNYNVDLSEEEALAIKDKFWNTYSFLKKWSEKERIACKARGYALTRGGRKRYFADMDKAYCEMINTAVQGSCGEVLLETLIALPDYLKGYLVNTVHDELVFEIPEYLVKDGNKYREIKRHITEAMITGVNKVEPRYPTLNITEIKDTDRL